MTNLVTLDVFHDITRAHASVAPLEAAGIPTVLADQETLSVAPHLDVAIGGMRLQVRECDVERALEVLGEHRATPAESEPEETTTASHPREQLAQRAFNGAIIGLAFWPIQFYVTWVLWKVLRHEGEWGAAGRRRAWIAAMINGIMMVPLLWLVHHTAAEFWSF